LPIAALRQEQQIPFGNDRKKGKDKQQEKAKTDKKRRGATAAGEMR
jgi:hypothetical protein